MSTANDGILPKLFRRFLLRPLGLSQDNSLVFWLLLIFGFTTAGSLWYFQGDVAIVLAILYLLGILILSLLRPDYSLAVLMAGVLIFDQFPLQNFESLTYKISYFSNLNEITYLPPVQLGINIIEIHLLFLVFSTLLLLTIFKDLSWRPIPVYMTFILFSMCFLGWGIYGFITGADALHTGVIRAFIYFLLLYLLVPQIIRESSQLHSLIWIFIVAIALKSVQAIWRLVEIGWTSEVYASQENPGLTISLLVLLLGLILFKQRGKLRMTLLLLLLPLLIGFYLGMQAAAYIALFLSLFIFCLLLPARHAWTFVRLSLPVIVAGGIYAGLYWSDEGRVGQPIQLVKAGIEQPAFGQSELEQYSENIPYIRNQKVNREFLFGTGFGNQNDYASMSEFLTLSSDAKKVFLWFLVRFGVVGFFAFWFFINSYIARATRVLQRIKEPYLKVVLMMIIVTIISQIAISVFEPQLIYYRSIIFLGCVMGFLTTIEQYLKKEKFPARQSKSLSRGQYKALSKG